LPFTLLAHGSHGSGIMAGFTHPIFGLDHAIAILGTGFLGYLLKDTKWYLVFLPFIIAMIIGGFLGINQDATLVIEKVIALSVLIIGLFSLFYKQINIIVILISLAIFGFFHGFAHGAEMPATTTSLQYISGYSLGALLMNVIGMLIGRGIASQNNLERNFYFVSGILAGCGIMILLA